MSEFRGSKNLEVNEFETETGKIIYTVTQYGAVVANVGYGSMYPGAGSEEVMKANAHLFAAAPELLEACLRIQAQFRQAGIASVAGSLNPVEDNAAQIDAVILKALGQ